MSYEDETTNTSSNPHINDLVESRLQDPARRGLLQGGFGAAALSFIGGTSLLAGCGGSDDAMASAAPSSEWSPPRPLAMSWNSAAISSSSGLGSVA